MLFGHFVIWAFCLMGNSQSSETLKTDINQLFHDINFNLSQIKTLPDYGNDPNYQRCRELVVNAQVAFLYDNNICVIKCLDNIEYLLPKLNPTTETEKYLKKTWDNLGKLYKVYDQYWT